MAGAFEHRPNLRATCSARFRIGLPYGRPGPWVNFDDAVAAVVDDDRANLLEVLAALGV